MADRNAQGGGLNDAALAPATDERGLSGTGGAEGGGTRSGAGEPTGGVADRVSGGEAEADPQSIAALGQLAGRTGSEEAAEAAALGSADGSLADAAGQHPPGGTSMGDALRSPGRDVGSGTPGDRGELGGGDPKR